MAEENSAGVEIAGDDDLMTTDEVGSQLGVNRNTVIGLIEDGFLDAVRVGRKTNPKPRFRIYRTSLHRYLAGGGTPVV